MNKKPRFLSKVLGGGPPSSANQSFDSSNLQSPQLRPSASQHTTYSAGDAISCMDRSSNGQRCVIGGAKVFKVLRIEGSTITEEIDLRAAITSYASTHDHSAATAEQLSIRAVSWSHSSLESTIITASGNGRVTIYDLNRGAEGFEVARIQDHVRQVHKLAISPHKDNWLLSASQDGTVRFFDIKKRTADRNGSTFGAQLIFNCNAGAVRDVKWSITEGFEFACCTDQGVIQKWDIRKTNAPILKLQAHTSSCRSISWHPDGEHLASGGADQMCKVWVMGKKADRNQKPSYVFTTPAPLARVTWRPPCWSATAQGKRAAQIAVAYDDLNSAKNQIASVHVWDLARSAMPFKEIEHWNNAPATMLWNTRDFLWSADKDGNFIQTDVAFVPKLIDRRSLSTVAFSPTGEMLVLLEQRQPPQRSRPSISPEVASGFTHRMSGPLLSASKSDSEEDVVGSFLGPRQRKGHRRRHSGRSSHTLSTTPPTASSLSENKVMTLEDAIKVTGTYKSQQIMGIGHAQSSATPALYKYFSSRYLHRLYQHVHHPDEGPLSFRIASIAESFAKVSEDISYFRLAQSWRLLGFTMQILLDRRAEYHRDARLKAGNPPTPAPSLRDEKEDDDISVISVIESDVGEDTPRKDSEPARLGSPLHHSTMSLISEEIESTSNVATPIVRPVRDYVGHGTNEAMHTSITADDDELKLPEAVHPKTPSPIPVPGAKQSPELSSSSVEGYDFYGLESFSPTREYVAPKRKQPLRLDYSENGGPPVRIQPQRHDSNESFQMFSTSGDSVSKFMNSEASGSSYSYRREDSRALRDRVHEWENSHSPDRKHRPSIDSEAPFRSDSSADAHAPSPIGHSRAARNGQPFNPSSPPVFRVQEASSPSVVNDRRLRPSPMTKTASPSSFDRISEATSQDPNIIPSDYLPWPNDPSFITEPIDPAILVPRAIDFAVQNGAMHASIMILLFRLLLPPGTIAGDQAIAVLKQYHHRLLSMKLFIESAELRNICVPDYPEVYATSQEDVKVGFFCTGCNKPLENDPKIPESQWRCPRCTRDIEPCPVCEMRYLDPSITYPDQDPEDANLRTLWFYCPGCGHGGHAACMLYWHSGEDGQEGDDFSGGCCPLVGCLHACLPGKWREEVIEEKRVLKEREMDAAVKEGQRMGGKSSRNVIRDQREVGQSRAVEGVRVALGISGGSLSGGGSSIERKKSVKLVAPGEHG